ncbi:MAG: hypothetical protein R3E79_62040 [Caldilineaceae bacterium]
MHELVRQYGAAQLGQFPEERHAGLARHAAYYIALVHGLAGTLLAAFDAQGAVQSELDNIRTAWLWSATQNNLELLAMGVESLQSFYRLAGLHREAIYLLETALTATRQSLVACADLAAPAARPAQQLLARLLCHTAQFYRWVGGVEIGEHWHREALTVDNKAPTPGYKAWRIMSWRGWRKSAAIFSPCTPWPNKAVRRRGWLICLNSPPNVWNDGHCASAPCMHPQFAIPHFHEALHYLRDTTNRYLGSTSA